MLIFHNRNFYALFSEALLHVYLFYLVLSRLLAIVEFLEDMTIERDILCSELSRLKIVSKYAHFLQLILKREEV